MADTDTDILIALEKAEAENERLRDALKAEFVAAHSVRTRDLEEAARLLMDERDELKAEVERLKADRDRFQAIVHAVSPYLDPSCLGLTPEMAVERLKEKE